MERLSKLIATAVFGFALMGSHGAAADAVEHSWHLDSGNVCKYGSNGYYGGACWSSKSQYGDYTFESDNGMDAEASGWYENNGTVYNGDQYLRHWSGLSMDRPGENAPWHGVDNQYGAEFVVFTFDEAISLRSFNLGYARQKQRGRNGTYYSASADVTVMYRAPEKEGTGALNSTSIGSLTGAALGYTVAGHWDNIGQGVDYDITSVTENIFSKVWAIGTYIAALTGTEFGTPEVEHYEDAFKLKTVAGITKDHPKGETPLPGSLALIVLGLMTLRYQRRDLSA